MTDREFLLWVADRLVQHYGDNPNTDFVSKLVSIAYSFPPERVTLNTNFYPLSRLKT